MSTSDLSVKHIAHALEESLQIAADNSNDDPGPLAFSQDFASKTRQTHPPEDTPVKNPPERSFLQRLARATIEALDMYIDLCENQVTEAPIFIAPRDGFIATQQAQDTRERLRTATGPLELVLHAQGGGCGAVFEIVHALNSYRGGEIRAYIPRMAYSGATMIALAAHRIYMGKGAVLGAVDPQFGNSSASDILSLVNSKRPEELDLPTQLLAIRARKAYDEVRAMVATMVETPEALERLTSGFGTHNNPIPFAEASMLRLPVEEGVPDRLYNLLQDHLQPDRISEMAAASSRRLEALLARGPRGFD